MSADTGLKPIVEKQVMTNDDHHHSVVGLNSRSPMVQAQALLTDSPHTPTQSKADL